MTGKKAVFFSVLVFGLALEAGVVSSCEATMLQPEGNAAVVETFERYSAKASGCVPLPEVKRVIVTGFGPFTDTAINISGSVVDAMADSRFWPEEIDTDRPFDEKRELDPSRLGRNSAADAGARASSRLLKLDGQSYQVCFVVLDVLWDLSAAIVVREMEIFQPDLVIMTGLGDLPAIFESDAANLAAFFSGFDHTGGADLLNTPVETEILPAGDAGVLPIRKMSWNPARAYEASHALIEEKGFLPLAASEWRSGNDYICNHLAFVAENAARGIPLTLAGGRLRMSPVLKSSEIKTGFFHYPLETETSPRDVYDWARMISKVIRSQF